MMESIKMHFGPYRCQVRVNMAVTAVEKGWNTFRHCHAEYELHFALRGSCMVDVGKQSYILTEGDMLLTAPGQYHCPKNASANFEHFVILFLMKDSAAEAEFLRRITPCKKMQLKLPEQALLAKLIEETQTQSPFWQEIVRAQYVQLMGEIFRMLAAAVPQEELLSVPENEPRLFLIDEFFERNLTEYATEKMLAQQLNVSRRQLTRVLQTHYGMGFREKMRCARMDCAGWLLRTTDMPVSKISEAVGYQSATSFFKVFRRHYRMTPLAYRREVNRNEKEHFEP